MHILSSVARKLGTLAGMFALLYYVYVLLCTQRTCDGPIALEVILLTVLQKYSEIPKNGRSLAMFFCIAIQGGREKLYLD
jgi:hypothetical protein